VEVLTQSSRQALVPELNSMLADRLAESRNLMKLPRLSICLPQGDTARRSGTSHPTAGSVDLPATNIGRASGGVSGVGRRRQQRAGLGAAGAIVVIEDSDRWATIRFLAVHSLVTDLFAVGRHHLKAIHYRIFRDRAFAHWRAATALT
jgi:hypothetical protein